MKYRLNTYLTLKGRIQAASLPDAAYGEWIVNENNEPKYHVNIFNYESKSDCLIFAIMNESKPEIKDILIDINNRFKCDLTLPLKINLGIKINSKLIDSELNPLPFEWIDHYTKMVEPPWEKHPHKDPKDMFWRMGKGEDTLLRFSRYYNALDSTEKKEFEKTHSPTNEWSNYYK